MFIMRIADHTIQVDNKYDYIFQICKNYISDDNPEFTISASKEEIIKENNGNNDYPIQYLESFAIYRKICERLLDEGIIHFHCSALAIDGKSILFTGPSGTGKSSHSREWRTHFGDRVKMINDDEPLLHIGDTVMVYGTPFSGEYNLQTNTEANVSAIIIIYQSTINTIKQISAKQAFPLLLNQSYFKEEANEMLKAMKLIERLSRLPVFLLGCNISDEAVMTVYNELKDRYIL